MQLYYIRHAQSANNAIAERLDNSRVRVDDPELTELGRRQAGLLARRLARTDPDAQADARDSHNRRGFGITHVYTSLMVRSVATGTAIACATGLPLTAWTDLHETGGIYLDDEILGARVGRPGKNRAYFEAHYPGLGLPDTLGEAGWWNRAFEERPQRYERGRRFAGQLLERHGGTGDRVAVVSHGGFFNYVLCAVLNQPVLEGFWFAMHNAAISRLDFNGPTAEVVYLNRADHLPDEMIT